MSASYTRNLVGEQYAVLANRARLFVFHIVKPCGTIYEVDPVADTCTCKAGQNGRSCCHRTQLQALLRAESRRLLALSETLEITDPTQALMLIAEVKELIAQWKDVQSARGPQFAPASPAPVTSVPATPAISRAVDASPGRSATVAAYHENPNRFAIWGQNRLNRAWICLGKEYRSREEAENIRATVYAPSSRYTQTSVRPARVVIA